MLLVPSVAMNTLGRATNVTVLSLAMWSHLTSNLLNVYVPSVGTCGMNCPSSRKTHRIGSLWVQQNPDT